jgi:hypothetical protein
MRIPKLSERNDGMDQSFLPEVPTQKRRLKSKLHKNIAIIRGIL